MTLKLSSRFRPALLAALVFAPLLSVQPAAPAAPEILTPKPPATPRINGPTVFGVRPGSPFLYAIPATGERPMTFSAENLPAGLQLDTATGQITGSLAAAGEYDVTLGARNAQGTDDRIFRIVAGEKIALTPPMGWNSWNCWAGAVDQQKVLQSARGMVASGLAQHGWTYMNIDDTWQGERGGPFHGIQPDPAKFPDMKGLADTVHAMGLKLGIYSTPWTTSYAVRIGGSAENPEGTWTKPVVPRNGHLNRDELPWAIGRYHFVQQDVRQWAAWGIDYLKYDWAPNRVPETEAMAAALRASGRDIVYSLSNSAPYARAADWARLANCWRTTGDIRDTWKSMSGNGFSQDKWFPYAGPGHWNDPDMLVVGSVGWGPKLHPTRLTPDEQYTHISLWCLLSSPLLLGCDLDKLDDFTLGLLTNDEVLAIDQDALGKQATSIGIAGDTAVYAKPLENGGWAVGLFNLGPAAAKVTVRWQDLALSGRQNVRDLWRQKDLGGFADDFSATVASHGVVLVKVSARP